MSESIEIPLTDAVQLSYDKGNIRRLIAVGHLNGELVEDAPEFPITLTGWDFVSDEDYYILRGVGFLNSFPLEDMVVQVSGQTTWTFPLSQEGLIITDTEIRVNRYEVQFNASLESDWVTAIIAGEDFASNEYKSPAKVPTITAAQIPWDEENNENLTMRFRCSGFYSSTDDYRVEKLVNTSWVPIGDQYFQYVYDSYLGTYLLIGFGVFEDQPGYENGVWRIVANNLASDQIVVPDDVT